MVFTQAAMAVLFSIAPAFADGGPATNPITTPITVPANTRPVAGTSRSPDLLAVATELEAVKARLGAAEKKLRRLGAAGKKDADELISIRTRLDGLETTLVSMPSPALIRDIQDEVSGLGGRVTAVEGDITQLTARVTGLEASDQAQNARLDGLEDVTAAQGAEIVAIKADVEALKARPQGPELRIGIGFGGFARTQGAFTRSEARTPGSVSGGDVHATLSASWGHQFAELQGSYLRGSDLTIGGNGLVRIGGIWDVVKAGVVLGFEARDDIGRGLEQETMPQGRYAGAILGGHAGVTSKFVDVGVDAFVIGDREVNGYKEDTIPFALRFGVQVGVTGFLPFQRVADDDE